LRICNKLAGAELLHCGNRRVPSPSFTPYSCVLATLAIVSYLKVGFPQRQPVEARSHD